MFFIEEMFGIIGFISNIFVLIVIWLIISSLFGNALYSCFRLCVIKYTKIRTMILKLLLARGRILPDTYRRSALHTDLLSMQSFLIYLTDKYGAFDICPQCHFPHEPDKYSCPYCHYTPKENFARIERFIKEDI